MHRAFREQHRALDRVLELADVARPVVAHQQLQRVGLTSPSSFFFSSPAKRRTKNVASGGMSSLRSRSGGISIETTFSR